MGNRWNYLDNDVAAAEVIDDTAGPEEKEVYGRDEDDGKGEIGDDRTEDNNADVASAANYGAESFKVGAAAVEENEVQGIWNDGGQPIRMRMITK